MTRRGALLLVMILAVGLGAGAADSFLETAQRQFDTGNYAAAISTLRTAAAHNAGRAPLYYWLARCYYEAGDYSKATDEGEHAVKLDQQNSEYHLWLGRMYGRDAERKRSFWLARKTKHEFEEAVRLNPRSIPARRDLMEFYASALWIVGGSKDKAQEQIDAIAAMDPVEGALARAEYLKDINRLDGAEPEYRRVMELKPNRVDPYLEVADFYARRGDAAHMQAAIDAASHVNASDQRLSFYRGVVRVLGGKDMPEAEAYLKSYLAGTPQRSDLPSHADARTWLGQLYEREGKRLEAAEQYRAALQLEPDLKYARTSLERLEKHAN